MLEKLIGKRRISLTVNPQVHDDFKELIKKQYPKSNLSAFINNVLIDAIKEMQKFERLNKKKGDKK